MQFVAAFDPGAATSGEMSVGAVDPGSKVLLYNLSIVSLLLNFENGDTDILHAWEAKWWELETSTPTIAWKQQSVLTATPGPVSQVTVTVYRSDEEVIGTYPISLMYLLNLGNAVPLAMSASSIVNSGNAAGTPVVTAQVLGDGNNAVELSNDGQLTLGDGLYPGNLTINGGAISVPTVNAAAVNATTIGAGTVGAGTVNSTTNNTGTTNSTTINTQTITVNTILNLLTGSLTRVFFFGGSASQNFAHNFGVVPSCVLINYAGNFGVAPTQDIAWYSTDSNHIQVVGQTGYNYQGVAIHS